ncbi:unnamed protein product [Colias eurytheme]|nr:unnamed protein product [Colias eurytheme]
MQPSYSYPLVVADWNTGIIPLPSPMYTPPIQQIPITLISPIQIPTLPQCPYTYIPPESLAPNTLQDVLLEPIYYTPESSPIEVYSEAQSSQLTDDTPAEIHDPLDLFLQLPKDLFPTARMLVIDPNPIIDEFCKMENVNDNSSWILDLEFGIPRIPVTRAIAIYDVKLNSVQCKNTRSAIHPGFESCSEEFKRVFLFYYDCIVSTWYRGYMLLNCDKSVENFQSWLLLPMQILGMCWS